MSKVVFSRSSHLSDSAHGSVRVPRSADHLLHLGATAGDDVQVRLPSWGSPVRRSAGASNGVGAVAVGERDRERGAAAGYGGVVAEASRPPPRGSGMVLY